MVAVQQQMSSSGDESQQQQPHQDAAAGAPATTQPNGAPAAGPPKRKPSRRANTAERRATHNAVERARRETLNSRFLDLAALLPNLSQIRRPSKSAIVNSSIAHINASKRHRQTAARELRSLKAEADALRRELNEWRDRAQLPRIEEPMRGEGFGMILSGEMEVISIGITEEDEEGDEFEVTAAAAPGSDAGGQFYHEAPAEPTAAAFASHQGPPTPPASSHGHPAPQMHPAMMQQQQQPPQQQRSQMHPMVVTNQQVHFDPAHPANMHGMPQVQMPQHQHAPHPHFAPSPVNMHYSHPHQEQQQHMIQEKAAWNMGFAAAQRSMSNHGVNGWDGTDEGLLLAGRPRSGSMSSHSFSSASPPRSPGSSPGAYDYELGPADGNGAGYGIPRGLTVATQLGGMGAGPMMTSPVGGGAFANGMLMGMM